MYMYTQLAEDAPELAGLLDDMNAKLRELNDKISPVWTFVNEVRACVWEGRGESYVAS